jgi:hypothetical protein
MSQTPEEVASIVQRLDSIANTLERLAEDNAQALMAFRSSDDSYRKELEAHSLHRESSRLALTIGMILRVLAVVLLAYIAYKIS